MNRRGLALGAGSLILVLCLAGVSSLASQDTLALRPGLRVRLSTAPDTARPRWTVGTLQAVTAEEFIVRARPAGGGAARETHIPRSSVVRLDVSRASHSKTMTGLGLGFLGGAIVGGLLGRLADVEGNDLAPDDAMLIGAGFGGGVGLVMGGAIGATTRVDDWQPIPRSAISRRPGYGGPQRQVVGLSIRF